MTPLDLLLPSFFFFVLLLVYLSRPMLRPLFVIAAFWAPGLPKLAPTLDQREM